MSFLYYDDDEEFEKLDPQCYNNVILIDSDEEPDSHNCRSEADEYGFCTVCGATVYGTLAYYEERGCDPPGTY